MFSSSVLGIASLNVCTHLLNSRVRSAGTIYWDWNQICLPLHKPAAAFENEKLIEENPKASDKKKYSGRKWIELVM